MRERVRVYGGELTAEASPDGGFVVRAVLPREAADGRAAVDLCRTTRPDVVLMDIRMPVMDGVAATREITRLTDSRVLVLTTYDLDEYVFAALDAGASGSCSRMRRPRISCAPCTWWPRASRCSLRR